MREGRCSRWCLIRCFVEFSKVRNVDIKIGMSILIFLNLHSESVVKKEY